ncbi:FAD-dependent oxidoreductase [Neosynechococcus sphagnicola]|uniref:FAD-dependent oxidoreductase n=1 Tax=Neosynechococcus sphagnicola TaxID=1501145 RepID=UPI000AEA2C95|nr:FAD-dependent oxidoreductase [Neosynechococcus sphagnicola]
MIQQALLQDGIQLVLQAQIQQVVVQGAEKVLMFQSQGQAHTVTVDAILVGAGRAPNIEDLNLEAVGVAYDPKRGVQVNDHLQTTNPRIYAAGDVCMQWKFTHAADAAARIVIQNALFLGRKQLSTLTMPWVTYTDPEVAHVGLYEPEAKAQGIAIDTFQVPLTQVDRAIADGETTGFAKLHLKQGTDKILGATIVARHAGDMISEVTLAMVGNLGLKTLASVIHPYPTQAEVIRKVADAYNRTRLTPRVKRLFERWLAWTR